MIESGGVYFTVQSRSVEARRDPLLFFSPSVFSALKKVHILLLSLRPSHGYTVDGQEGCLSHILSPQDAVYNARKAAGLGTDFLSLDAPATPERLRMACADHITAPFAKPDVHIRGSC